MSGRITIKPPLRKPTVVVPASTSRRGSTIRIPAPREASPTSTSPPSEPPAAEDDEDEVMEVDEPRNAVVDASNDGQEASSSAQTLEMSASREVSEGRSTPAIDIEDTEEVVPRATRGRPRGRPRGSRARGPGRARGGGRGFSARQLGRGDGDDGDETPVEGEDGGSRGPRTRVVAGRTYVIDESELLIDGDPKGDLKVDADGNLLEGRSYKANTFTLPNRHPTKLFMLAIDAARTSGFRDSLYFFRKNPLAYKLNATQDEKEDLISRSKLGGHLRTRAVTLIAARTAYKLHGAKMVQNGRWVVDDYYEDRAAEEVKAKGIEAGTPVGEPPDPRAPKPAAPGGDWEEREQRERTGEWGMYRPGGPTTLFGSAGFGPFSEGPLSAPKKAFYTREGVDEHNWMFEAARRAREADADWARSRKNALKVCGGVFPEKPGDDLHFPMGVYEPHAAVVFYRSDTQPTASRWERLPDGEHKKATLGGTKAGKNAWGLAWVDTVIETPTSEEKDTANWTPIARI